MLEHTTLTARVDAVSAWELTEGKRRLLAVLLQAWQCCSMKLFFVIKNGFGDQVLLLLFYNLETKAQTGYVTFSRSCEPKVMWEENGRVGIQTFLSWGLGCSWFYPLGQPLPSGSSQHSAGPNQSPLSQLAKIRSTSMPYFFLLKW